ncbi:alpha-soluble NSF attachment protein-like [Diorhabda sublineata]|uniref:alpha-soluble NSF attachment protein-like n=1 Tax=Diorhabda sublineata TaxID=1163346 RepID=UPI0024E14D7B|nr:alpha-soluble NSF attachment protein-like [Diorhabda sublineata]
MSHIEVKACQLREEAKRRVKSASFLQNLFSKSVNKTKESIEYYKRAGNLFKVVKNWNQAGIAFTDAANLCCKANDFTEAALNFVEAAHCYKKIDTLKAIEIYQEVVKIYRNNGKFSAAAQYYQAIGELLLDDGDNEDAIKYFEEAAVFYKHENRYTAANKCLEKIADFAALSSDYLKAIKIFEELACFDLASSIIKHQVKYYLFKAAICLLCIDTKAARKLVIYINMYPAFEESIEYQLILCLLKCIMDNDIEGFEKSVRTFDKVNELSQWHVTLLLRIKNQIEIEYTLV